MFIKTKRSSVRRKSWLATFSLNGNRLVVALGIVFAIATGGYATATASAANLGSIGAANVFGHNAQGAPNDARCLDVAGNVNANGTKIQLWNCIYGGPAQQWKFVHDDNSLATGSLRIYSDKCLDIANGATSSGTKVQLYTCSAGNAAQRWTRLANGSLLNPNSGKCVDAAGGSFDSGTQIQIWDCHNDKGQKWYTYPNSESPIRGIAGKCLDVANGVNANGTKVQVWNCNGTEAQDWEYIPYRNGRGGALHIKLFESAMRGNPGLRCLDIPNATTTSGANLQLWDCNGTAAQEWQPMPNGSLKNPNSGKCLDAAGNSSSDGTRMILWDCNGVAGQKWNPFIQNTDIKGIAGKCVNNDSSKSVNGNPIELNSCSNTYAQRFAYVPSTGTSGSLRWDSADAKDHVSRCIDVTGGSKTAGTKLQLWECNGTAAQEWKPQANGTLFNPRSGLCMQTDKKSSTNDTRLVIQACESTPSAAQKWIFARIK